MKFNIQNFNGTAQISVDHAKPSTGPVVLITSDRIGFSFVHMLTPDQARFMAAGLQIAAEEAEATKSLEAQP